jgi:GTP-binding protein
VQTPIFLKSAAAPADFTDDVGREVAFVGRSNSGKSTALNLVAGQRKLARVSKTPGRTQLINFFEVAPERRLVDLPGYGFARVAPGTRERWRRLVEAYITQRRSLVGVMITVDIRRGITELDDELLRWLRALDLPVALLLTKADKLSRGAGLTRQHDVKRALPADAKLTRFSSLTHDGVPEARAWLASWLHLGRNGGDPQEASTPPV